VTRTKRPKTWLVEENGKVRKDLVLKREWSFGSRDVILPKKRNANRRVKRAPHRWISQEYAPLLCELGEFRVVCVGLEPLLTFHTVSKDEVIWDWRNYDVGYSLLEIE
jgi:hypothetical protein